MHHKNPAFKFTNDKQVIEVRLAAYGYSIGDTDATEFCNKLIKIISASKRSDKLIAFLCAAFA